MNELIRMKVIGCIPNFNMSVTGVCGCVEQRSAVGDEKALNFYQMSFRSPIPGNPNIVVIPT